MIIASRIELMDKLELVWKCHTKPSIADKGWIWFASTILPVIVVNAEPEPSMSPVYNLVFNENLYFRANKRVSTRPEILKRISTHPIEPFGIRISEGVDNVQNNGNPNNLTNYVVLHPISAFLYFIFYFFFSILVLVIFFI